MTRLLLLQARNDRRQIVVWLLLVAVLVAGTSSAVTSEFPTAVDRTNLLRLALATPALLAFRGVVNGSSQGSVVFFQSFSWLAVAVGLLNTFLATRHGRADEEQGRRELVAAAPVPRTAPVRATLALGALVDLAVAIVATAAFALVTGDLAGSSVAGAALGVTGFAFLGLGLLANQLTATSRAANSLAGVAVGVAYLLRAAGDALGRADLDRLTLTSAWPSWLSPIGWGEQTFALTDDRLWPLLPGAAFGALTAALAIGVQRRRDLGQSLLPERLGRPTASRALRSHLGLTWRLQGPAVLGWAAGAAVLGMATGALAGPMADATQSNPQVTRVLASLGGTGVDAAALLTTAVLGIVAALAAAAGVQAVLRLRSDETSGSAELLLSTRLSRRRWLLDTVVIGAVAVLAAMAAAGLGASLAFWAGGDSRHSGEAAVQALASTAAPLVFVGVASAVVILAPRLASAATWGLYAVAVVVGMFGLLLDLPDAVRMLSPLSHLPASAHPDWPSLVTLLAVALALAGVAVTALRRRDLSP